MAQRKPNVATTTAHGDYGSRWRKLRWMQTTLLFLVVAFMPLFSRLSDVTPNVFHDAGIDFVLFSAWGLAMVWTFGCLIELRCPRCGGTFFRESWLRVRIF